MDLSGLILPGASAFAGLLNDSELGMELLIVKWKTVFSSSHRVPRNIVRLRDP